MGLIEPRKGHDWHCEILSNGNCVWQCMKCLKLMPYPTPPNSNWQTECPKDKKIG